ncbi:MAG: hypothetical protein RL138_975 [Bacteroidota bacterium]
MLQRFISILTIIISLSIQSGFAQQDSSKILKDSTLITTPISYSKDAPDTSIVYKAADSMLFDVSSNQIYLWNEASIDYKELQLKAFKIGINWQEHVLSADQELDSNGTEIGRPHFTQDGQTMEARRMLYNYETKKGKIYELLSKEDQGIIHSSEVKRIDDSSYFSKKAVYTTCDAPHPHFGFEASKMKVVPNKLIVAGPTHLVISNIPTPLVLPFAIFPISKEQSSGLILPAPGQDLAKGFFLRHGGYYFALGHHHDMALTGDIYSLGSYGVQLNSNYNYLYKFKGNLALSYSQTRLGDPQESSFRKLKDFKILWNHVQDNRANPNYLFSASVQMGSSRFDRNNSYEVNDFLTNTYQSSVSYQRLFPGKPFNMSLSATHSQNNRTREMNFDLPSFSFSMNRQFPFARKKASGAKRWYESIGISYNTRMLNHLKTYDTLLLNGIVGLNDFDNGMIHQIPVSASFNVLKYINISPNFNYTERWYSRTSNWEYDSLDAIVRNRVNGYKTQRDWNVSLTANTRIYGIKQFKKGKLKAIRHILTPSASLIYHPDYGQAKYDYWRYTNTNSNGYRSLYSIFDGSLIGGAPTPGKYGAIALSLNNDLDVKVYSKKDSISHTQKLNLLRSFNISTAYNMAADSFRWSNVNIAGNTTLFQKVNIVLNIGFEPYHYENRRRVDQLAILTDGKLGKLHNINLAVGSSYSSKAKGGPVVGANAANNDAIWDGISVPFDISAYYILTVQPTIINYRDTTLFTQSISGSFHISPTSNWRIGLEPGYNFRTHSMGYTNINITRDIHCWVLRINVSPGHFYSIDLNVKASMLNDMKLSKRKQINPYFF